MPRPMVHPGAPGRRVLLIAEERPFDRIDRPGPDLTLVKLGEHLMWLPRELIAANVIEPDPTAELAKEVEKLEAANCLEWLGRRVHMDGDEHIAGVVTAFLWREEAPQFEVQWFSNGQLQTAWISPKRLTATGR